MALAGSGSAAESNLAAQAQILRYIAPMEKTAVEKTIRELSAMSREELYAEAVIMRGRIRLLRQQLAYTQGWLEMAERPNETVNH